MKSVIRLTQILWPLRKFEDPNVYLQVDAFAHIELKRAGEYVVPMSFHLMTVVGHLTMCVCVCACDGGRALGRTSDRFCLFFYCVSSKMGEPLQITNGRGHQSVI